MDFYESIIIGAGPAGIQMAYFLNKEHSSYLLLEHSPFGGNFFKNYPKHRKLISVNKVYCTRKNEKPTIENTLRYDWNSLLQDTSESYEDYLLFSKYTDDYYPSADLLVDYLNDYIDKYQLNIQKNTTVIHVDKFDNLFRIQCIHNEIEQKTFYCNKLILATGLEPKPIKIKNEHPNIYHYNTMPVDKEFYKHKNVLILGGGNAAFETANFINDIANQVILCGSERFAWNTHYPGNIRSVNMKIIDSYYLKLKVNLDWTNTSHLRYDDKLHYYLNLIETNSIWNSNIDIVIVCLGFQPCLNYIDKNSIPIELSKFSFPLLTNFYESISCKNVYCVGSLTQAHDYKHGTSAFIHGFRYNTRVLANYFKQNFQIKKMKDMIDLNKYLIDEINISSQLLHRFDFHGHIILINHTITIAHHIPLSCLTNINDLMYIFHCSESVIQSSIISCIYLGYDTRNPFYSSFRQPQTGQPLHMDNSVFIHPIVKFYKYCFQQKNIIQLHELHLPEHGFNIFYGDIYYYEILYRYWILTHTLVHENEIQKIINTYKDYHSLTKFMYFNL
jgi:thioredoxin reductase